MDLTVLKSENLPEEVMSFINGKIGRFNKDLEVIKHVVRSALNGSLITHRLYLFLQDRDVESCSYLSVVDWIELDEVIDTHSLFMDKMPIFDINVFMNLVPGFSSMVFKEVV